MNSTTKSILALAVLSFLLALSHKGGMHFPVHARHTAAVEQPLRTQSQLHAPGYNHSVAFFATGISASLVVVGILSFMKAKSFKPSSSSSTMRYEGVSRELQQKLMRVFHGNWETADRLVSQVKKSNPHRSIKWCIEKVIYDLERDRGGR